MLKKYIVLLALLPMFLMGEPLSSINSKVSRSSGTSTSTSNSNYYKEQGGYNKDVHIIGSEKKFDMVRFTPRMFEAWRMLFVDAQSYDLISQLNDNGFVNMDGTLNESVLTLDVPLTPGKVIQRKEIRDFYSKKYTNDWIFAELQTVGVLDADGFLTFTDSFSETYNADDFEVYVPYLDDIQFSFSNNRMADAMRKELLRFIKQNSLSIHVTQEETTRYQSRKEGFFDSFLDQLGGDLLGKIFFKDNVKTVKQKMAYTPNFDVYNLFTNITFGFADAPYAKGAQGNVIYYGKKNQKNILVQYAVDTDNSLVSHLGVKGTWLNQVDIHSFVSEKVSAVGFGIYANELRESTDQITWMSGRFVMANYGMNYGTELSFGLSNYTSSFNGFSQLGLAFGFEGDWHITRFLGLYYGLDTNFGFDLFNSEGNPTWIISRYFLGLQTAVNPIQLRVGYEWVTGQDQVSLFEGMTVNLGFFF